MNVTQEECELWSFGPGDAETWAVLQLFDERIGSRVVEVGAHDENVSPFLASKGFHAAAVDLRTADPLYLPYACEYVRGDWCDLVALNELGLVLFDSFISISTIEHFGLNAYGEGPTHEFYDVIAMRYAWDCLCDGGTAYISVPFGREFIVKHGHWRVYDMLTLNSRLIQDFTVERCEAVVSGPATIGDRKLDCGDSITLEEAMTYPGDPPHVAVALKLRKNPVVRLAPDGR